MSTPSLPNFMNGSEGRSFLILTLVGKWVRGTQVESPTRRRRLAGLRPDPFTETDPPVSTVMRPGS